MRLGLVWLGFLGSVAASRPAWSEPPSFDRPGIAFSTGLTPSGSLTFEQGLPDFETDRSGGVRTTTLMADSNLRFGLSDHFELQFASALFNQERVHGRGKTGDDSGAGDTRVGLKTSLPASSENFGWAALGNVTLASGEAPFSNEHTQYDLGLASSLELGGVDAGLYVDGARLSGQTSWTISPSLSMAFSDRLSGYLEMGFYLSGAEPDESIAGGGISWMLTRKIQLDLSADFGLDRKSPDVMGGFGVSVLWG